MKGMMVTLLVLLMTGMVVGQQATNPADSNQKIGRFLLDMTDEWIDNLVHEGSLRAPIQPSAVNKIATVEIHYANSPSGNLDPVQITQVPSTETRALHFELSDADLNNLKGRGLRYTLREADRGKYDVVVIDYTGFIGPRAQTGAGSNSRASTTNQNNSHFTTQTRPVTPRPDNGLFNRKPFGTGNERDQDRRDSNSIANNGSSTNNIQRRTSDNFPSRDTIPQTQPENNPNRSTMSDFDRWAQQRKETVADEAARLARNTRDSVNRTLNPQTRARDDRTGFLGRDQLTQRGQDNRDIDYERRFTQDNNRNVDYDRRFPQDNRDIDYDRRFTRDNTRNDDFDRRTTRDNSRDIEYDRRYTQDNDNFRVRPVDTELLARQRRDEIDPYTLSSEQQTLDNMKFQAEQLKKQRVQQEIENAKDEIANELHRKEMLDAVRRKRERERWAMVPGNTGFGFTDDQRPLINYPSNTYPDRRLQDFVDPMADYDPDFDRLAQRTTGVRQPRQTGPVPASIGGPTQAVLGAGTQTNNAVARTNTRTNPRGNDVVLADQTQLTRLNQQNKLLWFMMLCSLGLNIYLGWIARSFYGRYEELADELRETFTTTVA